jgi:DNA-binding winged helix-turn-helix (wHTH) protein/TolB-like protein
MATSPADSHRVRFDRFELDVSAGELFDQGRRVRLQEQPRQVLQALLARPGEVVTREELRERLWKTDTFVDFEHGLNTAIKKVRQALGDSAETPRFVETLARRGYRFVAPVSPPIPEPAAAPPVPIRAAEEHRHVRWAAALFLLVLVTAAIWVARSPRDGQAGRTAQLAVLPLRVIGQGGDLDYLGVGIADAITTRLANVRQLALRPTSAVLPYRNEGSNPARVAAALGVQHLLVGTIQKAEQVYRVSVQLVGADGVALWGRAYDVPQASLLRLQDTVAEQVAAALRIELSPSERARLAARHTGSAEAFDAYLRGRALLVNYTEANMKQAIASFEEALARDSRYALARAALATACAWFSVRYAYEQDAVAWGERAEREARAALAADEGLGDAHFALASAAGTLYRGFDWRTLLVESGRALELDATLDLAHVARMRAYYHLGLFAAALREGALARGLNPAPNVETDRLEVAVLLFNGDFEQARTKATALLGRTDAPAVRHYLGLARYYTGDVSGAREILASARRGNQLDVRSQATLASIEAATGFPDAARRRAESIQAGSYMDHHVAYSLAAAWAQLGDRDAAFRWLEKAAATGFRCQPWFVRDPLLAPLRGDTRFEALTRSDATASRP